MMAKRLKQPKIGSRTPMWIGLDTVLGEVIGFVGKQTIIRFHIRQLHADGWHHFVKDYLRDTDFISRMYTDWLS
jgi:hypothetical protein